MSTDLLLDTLVSMGFALNQGESAKQTHLLEGIYNNQTLAQSRYNLPETTSHQTRLIEKVSNSFKENDYETALSFTERLLNLEKNNPLYYVLRGDCLTRLGKISEAIDNYDIALDINEKFGIIPAVQMEFIKQSTNLLEDVQKQIRNKSQSLSSNEIVKLIEKEKGKYAEVGYASDSTSSNIYSQIQKGVEEFLSNKSDDADETIHKLHFSTANTYIKRLVLSSVFLNLLAKLPPEKYYVAVYFSNPCDHKFHIKMVANEDYWLLFNNIPTEDLYNYIAEEGGFEPYKGDPSILNRGFRLDQIYDVALIIEFFLSSAFGNDGFELGYSVNNNELYVDPSDTNNHPKPSNRFTKWLHGE